VNYHWNWHIFFEPNPTGVGNYLDMLLSGLWVTIKISLFAWIIALVTGSIVGVLRTLPSKAAQWFGFLYVEFFRNMPLLVQLFLWFFVLPELLPPAAGLWLKQMPNAPFYTAAVGVGLFMSARVAVQLAAGIGSLPRGQKMAGTALGLTTTQVYRYVLLPMAFRIILPPLTSEFLNTIKNSAVAITIGLIELTGAARSMQEFSFQVFEAFSGATVMYLAINVVVVIGMRLLERSVAIPGYITGKYAMLANFDFDVIRRSLAYLFIDGMTFTLTLTALSSLGGLVFGTLIALMRLSGNRVLAWIAAIYVDFLRSLPLVLVIFWFYFLVPYIGQWITGASRPISVGAFASSLITFVMFEATYFSEIMRAGIQSISRGQPAAASALGLTYSQTMRYVVLPQAFRNMLPVLLTQTIVLFQDTSLVYVLSITDFLGAASKVAQRDGRLVEMYLFAALVYFIISCVASFSVRQLQSRIAIVR
jgi:glutamate/aspartate transport system permease protein